MKRLVLMLLCLGSAFLMAQSTLPNNTGSSKYVVFAWNDLGMHCLNPTYDQAVILPPYNNVKAQVVQRGNPPVIVTSGLTVGYSILGNTTSANKANFGQFWANAYKLFGVSPAIDHGLNLVDPTISNGLSGNMVVQGSLFAVDGIPLTPINDAGVWNPYQTGIITVKDATGASVASTNIIVPTSDEINCAKCHGTTNPFGDIMQKHDAKFGTNLSSSAPVLCASCHGSPVLGQTGPGSSGVYMSQAIHSSHANRGASCYDCHPGDTTKCNRSLAHTDASTGACTNCHGSMANVAATIIVKGRVPWANEPGCTQCHTNVPGVDTGATRFRDAAGHGQMACVACHNSPHAMLPSREAGDSYTTIKYQGSAAAVKTIGSCGACHSSNHGEGFTNWYDKHGKSGADTQSACNVCHTGFQNPIQANFPHQFQWNTRTATVGSGPVQNVPVVETPLPGTGTLAITTQPLSRTVTAGQSATFSVVATGTAPITYQWRKNGVAITGATATSYTTPATVASDSGSLFTVVVSNSSGSVTSNAASLTVTTATALTITTQPLSRTVTVGQSATFSVVATGTAPITYQWRKNGSAITGATAASYTTPPTVASDSGSLFTVVVSNSSGSVTSNAASLTVTTATSLTITTQPQSQTVTAGQSATFRVVATGTAPITYQWRKNGVAITGATGTSYTTPATVAGDSGSSFMVVVSNSGGSVTSNAANLTVLSPPRITTQPTNLSVRVRSTATFSVVATGSAPLSYQWYKNGVAVTGATAATYSFVTSRSDNNASIYVRVRNQLGSVNSNTVVLQLVSRG
jgi:hypothetical protein